MHALNSNNDLTLTLGGELTFVTVPDQLKHCDDAIRRASNKICINLAEITHSDSAGLALLIESIRLAKQLNKSLVFINPPPQMLAMAHVAGISKLLPFEK